VIADGMLLALDGSRPAWSGAMIGLWLDRPLLIGGDQLPQALDRILIAYDGSAAAGDALEWGLRLSTSLEKLGFDILAVEERTSSNGAAENWLEKALGAFSKRYNPPQDFTHHGEAGHEILAAADQHQSDLIVMGRPSHRLAVGSGKTTFRVLRGGQAVLLP